MLYQVSCSHLVKFVHYEFFAYLRYVTDIHKYVYHIITVDLGQYCILKTGIYTVLQIVAAIHK